MNRQFTKNRSSNNGKHKRYSKLLVIREMYIKTTRWHCKLVRMAKIRKADNTRYW